MLKSASELKFDKSIAVLPFVNMSADPENEYFSDGITEEIINALTKVPGLKVIARTSSFAFKGKQADVRSIGTQLGVANVLEGSVRKFNKRVRITAQLINALDGTHFWSRNFDRELEDIFTLQDEISLLIADQIRENFGHFDIQDHLVKQSTKDVKAYELFLKGRYHQLKWDPDSLKKAIEFYDEAIRYDADFARAYYGNLQCYGLLGAWGYVEQEEGFSKAIENFQKGSAIDTQLPEYTQSFVGQRFWGEWDFQAAYEQIVETLKINPGYTDAIEAMTELFIAHGYFDQAEIFIQKALSIDPISANHHYTLANIKYMQGKCDEAIQHLEKSLSINPKFELAGELKLMCLIRMNRRDAFDRFIADRKNQELQTLLFEVYNGSESRIPTEKLERWAHAADEKNQLVPYELFILANSDHKKEALDLLGRYVDQKRGQIINFRQEPLLEPLRQFDAFHTLHQSNFQMPGELPDFKKETAPDKASPSELESQIHELTQFIRSEKPYLDAQLSLSGLAAAFKLHPNKLSFLINEESGMNFNEFINQFRVDHFKQIANDPEFKNFSILGIAYESGFNSKTAFNTAFKKHSGMTPKEWLKTPR